MKKMMAVNMLNAFSLAVGPVFVISALLLDHLRWFMDAIITDLSADFIPNMMAMMISLAKSAKCVSKKDHYAINPKTSMFLEGSDLEKFRSIRK
jgi:hypothetical protein